MKALVGSFNQEKALVGTFSVIVKTDCATDESFYSTTRDWQPSPWPAARPSPAPPHKQTQVLWTLGRGLARVASRAAGQLLQLHTAILCLAACVWVWLSLSESELSTPAIQIITRTQPLESHYPRAQHNFYRNIINACKCYHQGLDWIIMMLCVLSAIAREPNKALSRHPERLPQALIDPKVTSPGWLDISSICRCVHGTDRFPTITLTILTFYMWIHITYHKRMIFSCIAGPLWIIFRSNRISISVNIVKYVVVYIASLRSYQAVC